LTERNGAAHTKKAPTDNKSPRNKAARKEGTCKNSTRKTAARMPRNGMPPRPPTPNEAPGEPVDGAEVFEQTRAFIRKYCSITDDESAALAIWTMATHAIHAFDCIGYVSVASPEENTGKSRIFDVLSVVVARPYYSVHCAPITLARKINDEQITVLYDEADATLKGRELLRAILNSGYKDGGQVTTKINDEPVDLKTFGPKAFAGIGKLSKTLASRCIPIKPQRLLPGEHVAKFKKRKASVEAHPIRTMLARWAEHFVEQEHPEPAELSRFHNRSEEIVEPLLEIAEACGATIAKVAANALANLLAPYDSGELSPGKKVLAAIRELFRKQAAYVDMFDTQATVRKLRSADIARELSLSEKTIANILDDYCIRSQTIRFGGANSQVCRGYYMTQFTDAFARYLPAEESES
jgi:hypothetical protein